MGGLPGGGYIPAPEYHNPDPLVRLIGPANEGKVKVEGVETTALIDTGACMSAITKSFAEALELELKSLDSILDIEGTGGGKVPYHGYVECRLNLPQVEKFDHDILMLVIDDSQYGARVPIQIGTLHIDMAIDLATNEERMKFKRRWERAEMASYLRMASMQTDSTKPIIDLDEITGNIHLTHDLSLGPFETATVSGLLKGPVKNSTYYKRVNVSVEPMSSHLNDDSKYCAVPGYTFLKPGSHRIHMMMKNLTARTVTVHQGVKIATMCAANIVPHMLAPEEVKNFPQNNEYDVTIKMKGASLVTRERRSSVEGDTQSGIVKPPHRRNTIEEEKPEIQQVPLEGEQLEKLYELTKLAEGTAGWMEEQQQRAKDVIKKYSFLFAMGTLDLGRTNLVKHKIELTDYTPIKDRYRRIPPHQYEEVRKHLKEMLDVGAIRRSNSPWASPAVLVRKKDGSLRFCIDLRKLNARTIKDAYSLPRIEDALDSLNGACIFTSLDLKSGYWQVELDESSIPLTAFTVGPLGFYECVRMPFGLTNAPATFQRLMQSCLGELHLEWCIIYLDDIIIFSKNPDDHLTRLEGVFERLAKAGLKLKPSKCEFFRSSLKYLGHIVSKDGIAMDPKKVTAILNWPKPKTVTKVWSFTGFTNYYRRFIKGYAKVARPLHELTSGENGKKKHSKVQWTERCQESFDSLKKICSESPVLAYADYTKPFVLHTDASTTGLGAVLYQKQEDGKERVIAYASRTLNKAERNYDAHKLEFLALKWVITDRFHEYLYGATFEVFTDNNPLTYILSIAKLDAMGHRWVASLGPYNFKLNYKPGKLNTDADSLSRINWQTVDPTQVRATMDLAQVDRTLILDPEIKGQQSVESPFPSKSLQVGIENQRWKRRQHEDSEIRKIIEMKEQDTWSTYRYSKLDDESMKCYVKVRTDLEMENELLYRRIRLKDQEEDTYQFVVPRKYRLLALELLHDQFGHLGIDRTTVLATKRFYWPHMTEEIRKYIQNCERCIRFKQKPEQSPLKPLRASYPLELIHMDFLRIGGKEDKNANVLVITDHFTRFAQAYVTGNQQATTAAKVFIDKFVTNYGYPERILTDQAQAFNGKLYEALCKQAKIKKIRMTPYHPQTNGQCEWFNRTLMMMLGSLPQNSKVNWQDRVSTLVHAYNCTTTRVTGFSPYFLIFGREPRIPADETFGVTFPTTRRNTIKNYVETLRKRLEWAYQTATEHIQKDMERRKLYYDRKTHCMDIVVGDIILVRQKVFGTTHKIEDRWEVPVYIVLEKHDDGLTYKVKKIGDNSDESCKTLHRNMLYPFMCIQNDESEEERRELVNPPSKLLCYDTNLLQEANLEMISHFEIV